MLAHFSLWRIRWRQASGSKLAIGSVRLACIPAFALLVLSVGDMSSQGQDQRAATTIHEDAGSAVASGNYYALVIGIDDYPSPLPKLKTAVADARAVSTMLSDGYGFQVQLLVDRDATRANILDAITRYRNTLSPDDNLLIYYAGHGYSDHEADKAYWLPADADSSYSPNRIIADDLTTGVRVLPARHVLVISDSCYSGVLTRDVDAPVGSGGQAAFIDRMLRSRSRTLMASGGDEPVSDAGTNGHSVFAYALLRALERTEGQMFTASDMFYDFVQQQVAGKSEQLPSYSVIRNSSHDEGDFVFSRKTMSAATLHPSGAGAIETPTPRLLAENPVRSVPGLEAATSGSTLGTVPLARGEKQAPPYPQKALQAATLIGTITAVQGDLLTLKIDDGGASATFTVTDSTRVMRIAAGADMSTATPLNVNDLAIGDRIMAALTPSTDRTSYEAVVVVAVKRQDVTQYQQQVQEDWQRRGVAGWVKSVNPAGQAIDLFTCVAGDVLINVRLTPATLIRRYSTTGSFSDTTPGTLSQITSGDLLRARGARSADGSELTADEIVFGIMTNIEAKNLLGCR